MNVKEDLIAEMKAFVDYDNRPNCNVLSRWIKMLEQDEQQTPTAPNPIGLRPRWVSAEHRLREIAAAMRRYYDANKQPPFEWLDEMAEIIEWKRNRLDKKIQAMQDAERVAAG